MTDDKPSDDSTDDHHERDTDAPEAFLLEAATRQIKTLGMVPREGMGAGVEAMEELYDDLEQQASREHRVSLEFGPDTITAVTHQEEEVVARVTHKDVGELEPGDYEDPPTPSLDVEAGE